MQTLSLDFLLSLFHSCFGFTRNFLHATPLVLFAVSLWGVHPLLCERRLQFVIPSQA